MDIQCPSCQRKLSIGDQYAGQLVKCPACNGVFSAPSLAPAMAPPAPPPPPPPASPPGTIPFSGDAVRPPATHSAPPPPPPPAIFEEEPEPEPSAPGSFSKSYTVELCPDVLRWVAPAAVSLIFLLSFFPWILDYSNISTTITLPPIPNVNLELPPVENPPVAPVSAVPVSTPVSSYNLWEISFGTHGTGLWIVYLLFTLFLALPLAWVKLLIEMNIIPKLDFLKPFWIWRAVAVGGFLAFIYLFALLGWFSFGPGQVSAMGLCLGLLAHVVAIVALGLEYWLAVRKKAKLPLPELTVKW